MVTDKMLHNAHKVTLLVKQYPEHSLGDIIKLLQMPAIDINAAIWTARGLGFLDVDQDKDTITLAKTPKEWLFGPEVVDLEDMIVFCFEELAKTEMDMDEEYLSGWTAGYPSQDAMVALIDLVNRNVLARYELDDKYNEVEGVETYTFYTLYDNREQLWGTKNFKINPITGELNDHE